MLKKGVILLAYMVAFSSQEATQKGGLHCLYDGTTYSMVLVVHMNTDNLVIMYATDAAGVKDTDCVSDGAGPFIESLGSGATAYWKVTVTFNGAAFTSDDCSAVQEDALKLEYKWYFSTRTKSESEFSALKFDGDMDYVATCDFENLEENLVFSSSIEVSGETEKTLSPTDEDVSFTVVESDGTTEVKDSALGDSIRLRMLLTRSVDGATGISPHDCQACDAKACDATAPYVLTDSDGCLVANQHIDTGGNSAFVDDTGAAPHEVLTTSFINFVFSGASQDVWFECKIEFCYGTGIDICEDRCQNNKRKKRDVNEKISKDNVTASAGLRINIFSNRMSNEVINVTSTDEISQEMCELHYVFLGITLALAFLLIGTIALAFRLHVVITKIRNKCGPAKA